MADPIPFPEVPKDTEKVSIKYVPVEMYLRFSRVDGEQYDRAIMVVKSKEGKEWSLCYEDEVEGLRNLIIADFMGDMLDEDND